MVAGPAAACDFHEGFGLFSGYESDLSYEEVVARQAAIAAEREKAMAEARANFLARFDIRSDAPAPNATQVAALSGQTSTASDADRSARDRSPAR
jgi:hypothetical protein